MLARRKNEVSGSKKSTFRRVSEWLHLWLGLISGIVVFVVCLTGGLWVFRYEVWHFTEKDYQQVRIQEQAFLMPSELISKSERYLSSIEDSVFNTGITYYKPGRSAICSFRMAGGKFAQVYMNPYTADILKDKRQPSAAEKFFIFVRAGHRFFWLPQNIGSPVVGIACIIFLISLTTGLIWWYPSKWTRKTKEKSFKIRWSAKWKRLNIDLHNILGFYSFLFVIILTISGIVYTFSWFEDGLYRTLTWKAKEEVKDEHPVSDITITSAVVNAPENLIWQKMQDQYGGRMARLIMEIPQEASDPFEAVVFFGDGTINYNAAFHYYDQKTLKELQPTTEQSGPYETLSVGEKVFRMNFDIHTGQILGLPSKILAFLACIVGAGLPITGFIIWYNRKWGNKRRKRGITRTNGGFQ